MQNQSCGEVSVCTQVAAHGLCIGCGACASLCPKQRLRIELNDSGCYEVRPGDQACGTGCRVCLRVCPFAPGNPNEDDLGKAIFGHIDNAQHRSELGFFQSCYVGYSQLNEQRLSGASGGLTTWFLTELLRRGYVNHVLCVTRQDCSKPFFNYVVCSSPEDVEKCARSAYYPVEMSRVIREMREKPGKFAVVCLPCFAKSLRLAAAVYPDLKQKLVVIAGLVCGHSASTFFGDYCAALADPSAGEPSSVVFRTKNSSFPAYELGIECGWGTVRKTVYWSQGPGEAWFWQWFTPNACLYCDDAFAEIADIAFMDAWLPEYHNDFRGTNLVVTRSELAAEVMVAGMQSGAISLQPVTSDDIVRSQEHVVANKTRGLAHRLWMAQQQGQVVPTKRIQPLQERDPLLQDRWQRQVKLARIGCQEWGSRRSAADFRRRMSPVSLSQRVRGVARKLKSGFRRLVSK